MSFLFCDDSSPSDYFVKVFEVDYKTLRPLLWFFSSLVGPPPFNTQCIVMVHVCHGISNPVIYIIELYLESDILTGQLAVSHVGSYFVILGGKDGVNSDQVKSSASSGQKDDEVSTSQHCSEALEDVCETEAESGFQANAQSKMETPHQQGLCWSPEEQQAAIAPPCDVPQDECPEKTEVVVSATKTEIDSNVRESQTSDTRRLSEDSEPAGEGHEPADHTGAEETVESFITNENIYVVSTISEEDVH